MRPPRPAAACGVTGAASPGGVPLPPPVAARAAPGGQAHDGRRRLQAELAEHAGDVLLVPDLGELAVARRRIRPRALRPRRCQPYDVGSLAAGSRGWNRGWRWDCRSCSVAGVELSGPAGLREMAPIAATLPAAEHGGYGAWPAHWRRARSASRLGWRAHAGGLANLAAAIHGGHAHLVAGRAIGRRAARAGLGPAAPLTRPATLRPLSLPLWLGSWATWVPAVIRGRAARRAGGGRWCSASVGAIGRFLAGGGLTGSRTASLRCRSTRAPNFFGIHSDAVIRAHRPPAGP